MDHLSILVEKFISLFSMGWMIMNSLITKKLIHLLPSISLKIIVAGASAYSRAIDWEKISETCKKNNCLFVADIAHYTGLIAAGLYPSPVNYADIITGTTHKTLRGPRGGFILTNNQEFSKKINSSVFPGNQGGPLMHVIAAKAVAFGEALQPSFKAYQTNVLENAKIFSDVLNNSPLRIVSGGTILI